MRDFNWGSTSDLYRGHVSYEIFEQNFYQKYFSVKEGDVVVDVGSSIGPFLYSIFDQKPKKCYAVEPFPDNLPTLSENCNDQPVVIIPKAITSGNNIEIFWEDKKLEVPGIKFMDFIQDEGIEKIDFLKIDCEGGEYDIFQVDNMQWILNNVKYCVGEWHLWKPHLKERFRFVRDTFFPLFKRVEVQSVDGYDIKWNLQNEHFLDYYTEVIIHIEI